MPEEPYDPKAGHPMSWPSTDLDRTADFHGRVFGWTLKPLEDAIECWNEGDRVGTFRLVHEMPAPGPGPLPVIAVDSIGDTLRDVLELGGAVVEDKVEIEGRGWMARIADPDGNIFGLIQFE